MADPVDLASRAGRKEQGRRIRRATEAAGLTLEELAQEIGCSRALIYQYSSGGVLAQPARLQRIAERTGYPLSFFYEEQLGAEERPLPDRAEASAPAEPVSPPRRKIAAQDAAEAFPTAGRETISSARDLLPSVSGNVGQPGPLLQIDIARAVLPYLIELAETQESCGDAQGLLSTCERILPLARETVDRHAEATAWLRLGNARVQTGHPELALPALRVALSSFEAIGNSRLALSCRQTMGRALLSLGNPGLAMAEFEKVAQGPSWDNRWQGAVSIAAVHEHRGEFELALQKCEDALEIVSGSLDQPAAAVEGARSYVMSNQANVYLACGDFANTMRLTRTLLATAERGNQRDQFVEGLLNAAVCQIYTGQWGEAEDNLLRAISLSQFAHDRPRWGLARALRAWLLACSGAIPDAKVEAKDALHLGIETSCRRAEIQAQISLGDSYRLSAAPEEAIYHLDQAYHAALATSSVELQCQALIRRCAVRLSLGQWESARQDAEAAMAESRKLGLQHCEALALDASAHVHAAADHVEEALAAAQESIRLADSLLMLHWSTDVLAARLLDGLQQPEEALRHGQQAIDALRDVRSSIRDSCEEDALLENAEVLAAFQQQVDRLMGAGLVENARDLVEEVAWPPLTEWAEEHRAAPGQER